MTYPFLNEGKIKIEEGIDLDFKVINLVMLQDGRNYYILEDPNEMKHFIDAETYANYGIEIGQMIQCRVAKINCTGRIYLEPVHPIYQEGQTYYFEVISFSVMNTDLVAVLKVLCKSIGMLATYDQLPHQYCVTQLNQKDLFASAK